jgi:redox-sensitive bicupin YhaK (pirin superfamily)
MRYHVASNSYSRKPGFRCTGVLKTNFRHCRFSETEETKAGVSLDWHNAPHRQYVITLSGRLEFETRTGARQVVEPGDILLAEDTSGGGIAGA